MIPVHGEDYKVRELSDFIDTISSDTNVAFRTQLSRLFSLSHEARQAKAFNVQSLSARAYELAQPKSFFKKLCGAESVREWIQQCIEDGDEDKMFFITEYRTFVDAKVEEESQKSRRTAADVGVPVADIMRIE